MTAHASRGRLPTFYLTVVGAMTIAASATDLWPTRLVYNASASVPLGWYAIAPADDLVAGDLVLVRPPLRVKALLVQRGYLGAGVPLVKQIAAVPGGIVCRTDGRVSVNGTPAAIARDADTVGRSLARWSGCRRLGPNDVFLLNSGSPSSFDGRYFGPTPARDIIGRARPLWTW